MIALARHHRLFNPSSAFQLRDELTDEQSNKAWKTWARQEESRRIAVLLYIHDAELAALFHHEPVFRHNAGYIPSVCSHELFSAPTAAVWASLLRAEQRETSYQVRASESGTPDLSSSGPLGRRHQSITTFQTGLSYSSMFNVFKDSSGIAAPICECRHLDLLSTMIVSKFESDLLTWYACTPKAFKAPDDFLKQTGTPFSFLPLWHYTFITLCTNLNLLELTVGREGTEVASSTRGYVLSWISSPDSKRCLLHALILQNRIMSANIGALIAFNTPRILFSAALCWYCYMLYMPKSSAATTSRPPSLADEVLELVDSLPEIQLLQEDRSSKSTNFYPLPHILNETLAALPKISTANPADMKAETLCVVESILRRLGSSGISLRFADIVQAFISGSSDGTSYDEKINEYTSQHGVS